MSDKWDNTGIATPSSPEIKDEHGTDADGNLKINGTDYWLNCYVSDDKWTMDLEFQKKGTRGDNRGKGHMKRLKEEDRKSDKYPHWKGEIETANGDKFEIAAWKREPTGKIRVPWLSFKVSEPYQGRSQQPAESRSEEEAPAESEFPY